MKYSLVSREVIADAIETSVNGQSMDGALVVGAHDDAAGEFARRVPDKFRIGQGRGPQDHAGDARGQPAFNSSQVANAAAQLNLERRRGEYRFNHGSVHGSPREGAVQVDDMEPLKALSMSRSP